MRLLRRLLVGSALAVPAMVALPAAPAAAHPLGNFTVNTYSGIVVAPGEVRVHYVLDMAEIPTFQALPEIDADGDGTASAAERSAWAGREARKLLRGIELSVDGRAVSLRVASSLMALLPGQGGLDVLRLEADFVAPVGPTGRLSYADRNFADLIGWREVTAAGADGRALAGSTVPARSVSGELRSYPDDLLASPLDVSEASFGFAPGRAAPAGSEPPGSGGGRPGVSGGAFAGLVSRPDLTVGAVVLSLLLALGFGGLHALAPGHGKTITAAYLVGSGGRFRQAVGAGVAVSVMHTASVLGLGIAILSVQRVFPAERVYPWLGLAAGLAALALGTWLLIARVQAWSAARGHGHDGHEHPHPHVAAPLLSRKGLAALALSGGLLPSPTALIVLLASVALHRVAFGLALIAAFSVGLAATLTAIGLLAVRARDVASRRMNGTLARLLPVASAAVIAAMGVLLISRSALQL